MEHLLLRIATGEIEPDYLNHRYDYTPETYLTPTIDPYDDQNMMPIHYAAANGHMHIVKHLVEEGCNFDVATRDGKTAAMVAAERGYWDIVSFLVFYGANVDVRDKRNATLLNEVLRQGNFILVQKLVNPQNVNNILSDLENQWPVLCAAQNKHHEVVMYLLSIGADPNCQCRERWTILHHACWLGWEDVVRLLLQQKNCSVNAANSHGNTPLHLACMSSQHMLVPILLKAGADPNLKNYSEQTVLNTLMHYTGLEPVSSLIQYGAFFEEHSYSLVCEHPDTKEILTNVEMCTIAVTNKFNHELLPAFCRLLSLKDLLPDIKKLRIKPWQAVVKEVERDVSHEIVTKKSCNVLTFTPMVLQILCVRRLLNYHISERPTMYLFNSHHN